MGEAEKGKPGIPQSRSVPAFLFLDTFLVKKSLVGKMQLNVEKKTKIRGCRSLLKLSLNQPNHKSFF